MAPSFPRPPLSAWEVCPKWTWVKAQAKGQLFVSSEPKQIQKNAWGSNTSVPDFPTERFFLLRENCPRSRALPRSLHLGGRHFLKPKRYRIQHPRYQTGLPNESWCFLGGFLCQKTLLLGLQADTQLLSTSLLQKRSNSTKASHPGLNRSTKPQVLNCPTPGLRLLRLLNLYWGINLQRAFAKFI